MVTTTTDGVKVSVETIYQPEYSNPANDHFMFAYKVNIENMEDIVMKYEIQILPTFLFFDSGKTETEYSPIYGVNKETFENRLQSLCTPHQISEEF